MTDDYGAIDSRPCAPPALLRGVAWGLLLAAPCWGLLGALAAWILWRLI